MVKDKSKEQLIEELVRLRQQVAEQEAELDISELRIASILEIANEAVITIDENQQIIFYNKGAEKIFGYSSDEIIGQSLDMLIPKEFRASHKERIKSFKEAQDTARAMSDRSIIYGLRKSGEEFPAEASISRIGTKQKLIFSVVLHDITKRRQMEKNLHESKDRYRIFNNLVSDYAYALDIAEDNRVAFRWITEAAFERLTEYSIHELNRANEIYHPDDLERANQDFNRTIAEGKSLEGEYRIITKSGEQRWLYVRRQVEWDESKERIIRVYGVAQDITEKKEMEVALRESEERYRILFEGIDDAITVHDDEANIVAVNEAACRRLGYSREELLNMKTTDIDAPDYAADFNQRLDKQLRDGSLSNIEGKHITKDGRVIDIDVNTRKIQYQGQPAVLAVVRDITERKQMEIALRESEEQHRKIVNMISDVAYTHQIEPYGEDKYIWTSGEALKRLTGYSAEEFAGFDIYHPEDKEAAREDYERILEGEPFSSHDYRIIRKDGEIRWVRVYRQPQWDEEKQAIIGTYGAVSDITESKIAEKRQFQLVLEKERVKILTEFITQASHEFKTPLSIIKTSTYLLSKLTLEWEQQRHITNIDEHVDYITKLVQDMITISKLDSGTYIDISRLELNQLVQSVHDSLQASCEKKNITAELELYASPLWLQGDVDILGQAVEHIYKNAVLFSDRDDTITLCLRKTNEHIIIEISDTGIGIHEEDLPQIFEQFYRVNKAGTLRGFGLGLAIAKRCVEIHHGRIEVVSEVGRGSTFRIVLPTNLLA